ncbi:hypothetical protein M885DRAFT_537247, partial [Pelagophyceae sp. CCMP2097]
MKFAPLDQFVRGAALAAFLLSVGGGDVWTTLASPAAPDGRPRLGFDPASPSNVCRPRFRLGKKYPVIKAQPSAFAPLGVFQDLFSAIFDSTFFGCGASLSEESVSLSLSSSLAPVETRRTFSAAMGARAAGNESPSLPAASADCTEPSARAKAVATAQLPRTQALSWPADGSCSTGEATAGELRCAANVRAFSPDEAPVCMMP